VIDNGSTDGTSRLLGDLATRERLPLRPLSEPRRGKSRALNVGVRAARGDLLAFTDDDAIVERGWVRGFGEAAAEHPECLGFAGRSPAVGGPVPPPRDHGIVNYDHGDAGFEIRPFETPPPGVNFAFRRAAFERYGLFREDLGPGSEVQRAEDTDFVRRLWLAGERLRYVPAATVRHPVHAERLARRFSLRWTFWVGRSNARMTGRPAGVPTVARVPRFLVGAIVSGAGRTLLSALTLRTGRDFPRAQRLAYDLGLAYEFRRLAPDFDPQALVPRLGQPAAELGRPAPGALGGR